MSLLETFTREVNLFIKTHGMRHTTFGSMAMNDPSFVKRLREGMQVKAPTIDKVRNFMMSHGADGDSSEAA